MPDLLTLKHLSLILFRMYKQLSDGRWRQRSILNQGAKYRFRLDVKNRSETPLEYGKSPIYYNQICVELKSIIPNLIFFRNSNFTEPFSNIWHSERENIYLRELKTKTFYAYFKWTGQNSYNVDKLGPLGIKVYLSADEVIVVKGTSAHLIPNKQ